MDDAARCGAGVPTPLPQLFHAPDLRCVEVSGRLVMLDLSAGVYDVADEVGTAMWTLLTQPPDERDIPGLARHYGVPAATVEDDLVDFATAQVAAHRLVTTQPSASPSPVGYLPRRRPTVLRAFRERTGAERDLGKDFAGAYTTRTGPMADTMVPRIDIHRATKLFRTAESLYPTRAAPLDCLPRSLALTRFLRSAGWPVQHVIGVALYPFEAHAWVELDGAPLNEGATALHRFAVIARA